MDELTIPSFFSQLIIQTESGPVCLSYIDIQRGEGEIVLITAGMDGDEYDGIQAAIQLGKQFNDDLSWKGRRVIFPLVNLHGFLAGVSFNPIDKKYPKYIYPGKKNGTTSEQIIFAIVHYLDLKFDMWIDLHGGSRVETLYPFVWVFAGGKSVIQNTIKTRISNLDKSTIIIITKWKKATDILHDGIMYILLEAGHKGMSDEKMTKQLVQWTGDLLNTKVQDNKHSSTYSFVRYYSATGSGYWNPTIDNNQQGKGNTIGIHTSFSASHHAYKVNTDSRILWFREAGWVKNKEVLVVTAEIS